MQQALSSKVLPMQAVPGGRFDRAAEVKQLVSRAQNGDQAAFEALYRENVGRIYALCLRLSGDAVRADELTQDVFVRAWEKLDSYRGESAFSTWLHRLAVNLMLEKRRSARRRSERVMLTDDPSLLDGAGRPPAPEVGIDLERVIASLPEGARTVFVLYDVEGYQHDEIAELMGLAPGTSKAQLHRARRLLREALLR